MEKRITKKPNSSEGAYLTILNGIMTGELKQGSAIFENEISEKYGIGRTPVREALKRLEGEGFIITSDRRKKVYLLTVQDIEEIFELKIAIEGMVAVQASKCRDKESIAVLRNILNDMEKYVGANSAVFNIENIISFDKWFELDKRFHHHIFAMANNHRAEAIIANLNYQWHRIRVGISAITGHMQHSVSEHLSIGNAILAGNSRQAYDGTKTHFENLKKYIINLMNTFGT